jgi:hypothetical protein
MESDKLVTLRFKINELKMFDFLEKKKRSNVYYWNNSKTIFRKTSICKNNCFGCRSLQNLRNSHFYTGINQSLNLLTNNIY